MRFVSQVFEQVRALLLGAREPDSSSHPDSAQTHVYAVQTPPGTRDAALAFACVCRAGSGPTPLASGHPLVRSYVLPPEERRHALRVHELMGVS